METIKLRLGYIDNAENATLKESLAFLYNPQSETKSALMALADKLYGGDKRFEIVSDNGRTPEAYRAESSTRNKHFFTLVRFDDKNMTQEALNFFGWSRDWDFRFYYGLCVCEEDRKLYIVSFKNTCSPNWNNEYYVVLPLPLDSEELDFPILKEDGTMYAICDSLHIALNEKYWETKPHYIEKDDYFAMLVKDQHGNYRYIEGESYNFVFRDYADNYTGYRNYRRQMASEWEIVSEEVKDDFELWKCLATGLKTDFDKFYGNGVVD